MGAIESKAVGDAMAQEILENLRRETMLEPNQRPESEQTKGVTLGVTHSIIEIINTLKHILRKLIR
jgi:hypothetical protein